MLRVVVRSALSNYAISSSAATTLLRALPALPAVCKRLQTTTNTIPSVPTESPTPAATPTTSSSSGGVRVYSWGRAHVGSLGHGDFKDCTTPTEMTALSSERIRQVVCGWTASLAVTHDGKLYQWGWANSTRSFMYAVRMHKYSPTLYRALQSTRLVFQPRYATPQPFKGMPPIRSCAAGFAHLAAITENGELYTWGTGTWGQMGHPDSVRYQLLDEPTLVRGSLTGRRVVQVSCGFQHTLILTDDGQAWACGKAQDGQLGMPTTVPSVLKAAVPGAAAEITDEQSRYGRVFDPLPIESRNRHDGITRSVLPRIKQVAAGFTHSVFVDVDGGVWTCGNGMSGALGHGDFKQTLVPTRVRALEAYKVVKVAVGLHHNVALTECKKLFTWGVNKNGQCGRPTTEAILSRSGNDTSDPLMGGVVKSGGVNTGVAARQALVRAMPVGRVDLNTDANVRRLVQQGRAIVDIAAGPNDTLLRLDGGRTILFGGEMTPDGISQPHEWQPQLSIHAAAFGPFHATVLARPL